MTNDYGLATVVLQCGSDFSRVSSTLYMVHVNIIINVAATSAWKTEQLNIIYEKFYAVSYKLWLRSQSQLFT